MAAKAKAKKAGKTNSGEMLLVGSKTKAALKAHGVNVAGDALDGLNGVVHWYIDQAAKRAAANGRKTVRPHDFCVG
jgi:histone H3/H4